MYYVYALIDVRNNLPFYIGKGLKGNQRHLDHFKETIDNTSNRHKVFKINHLQTCGFNIPVTILEDNIIDEMTAYALETGYIKQYGRANIDPGGILTNILLDSRPPNHTGRKQSSKHIANRVRSYKLTCSTVGRLKHSEETKRKIARSGNLNAFYGKTHSAETKLAHSLRMTGNRNNSKEYIFTSPTGDNYTVVGEFANFCIQNNLTVSTMEKALQHDRIPTSGKAKGWQVKRKEL